MRDDLMPKIKIKDNYSLHFNDIYTSLNIAAEWQILQLSLSHIKLNHFFSGKTDVHQSPKPMYDDHL